MRRVALLALVLLSVTSVAFATTVPADSCENKSGQTDVQDAIAACVLDGTCDKVTIPEGTCRWTTGVTISGKKMTLEGAGVGVTVIQNGLTTTPLIITVTKSPTDNFVRVTGIEFQADNASWNSALIQFKSTLTTVSQAGAFRLDHSLLTDAGIYNTSSRLVSLDGALGLIDHNTFRRTTTSQNAQFFQVRGDIVNSQQGYAAIAKARTDNWEMGDANANFFEDNVFDRPNVFASESIVELYEGGRSVFRFNSMVNAKTGSHGYDSGANQAIAQEEYYNDSVATLGAAVGGASGQRSMNDIRSGTGFFWGNAHRVTGTGGWGGLNLVYYRTVWIDFNGSATKKVCDGTQYDVNSTSFSSNEISHNVTYGTGAGRYDSTDVSLVCSGAVGGTCTAGVDGDGVDGYPCRGQPGFFLQNKPVPVLQWDNGFTSNAGVVSSTRPTFGYSPDVALTESQKTPLFKAGFGNAHWIAPGRDTFQGVDGEQTSATEPFDGTTGSGGNEGVGWGTEANRPTTCSGGTFYWQTDTGTWNESTSNDQGVQVNGADGQLFRCDEAGDSWTLYYEPYTYPHPLDIDPDPDTSDLTAPTVAITSPTTAATFTSGTKLHFAGTSSDGVGVTSCVYGLDQGTGTVTTTDLSGTTSWQSSANIRMVPGTQLLAAFCYDAAGNAGFAVVSVTFSGKVGVLGNVIPRSGGQ